MCGSGRDSVRLGIIGKIDIQGFETPDIIILKAVCGFYRRIVL